jgi:O-antigen/teichoic acid export membrane protein
MLTQNLLVLAVGYALSIFAFRALTQYFIRDIVKSVNGVKAEPAETKKITSIVAHNATKVGWVTLGAFMANRFNMLSISMFLGAVSAAQYAIAQQAFNALSTVSLVGVSMLTPLMANARVHNDKKLLRELLVFCNVSAWLIFACGLAALMVSGDWLLSLIHSQTTLPPTLILLLLAGVFFLDLHIFISTQFITTGNRVPHLVATVATGFLIAVGVFVSGMAGGHLIAFLVVQAALMLAYNAWRWPLVAGREVDLTLSNFSPSAIAGAKRILIRHDREPVERI